MAAAYLVSLTTTRTTMTAIGASFPHPIGTEISILVDQFGLNRTTTDALICAMLASFSIARVPGVPIQANPGALAPLVYNRANTHAEGVANNNTAIAYTSTNHAATLPGHHPELAQFLADLATLFNGANVYILDLVSATGVKELKPQGIKNYFLSRNIKGVDGRSIKPYIEMMANYLPRAINDAVIRAFVTDPGRQNDFVKYHITATSTPALVAKVKGMVAGLIPNMLTAATVTLIDAAVAEPWDKAAADRIPQAVVALTHAALDAFGVLPEDWYQGNKAKDATPPALYAMYKTYFTRFKAIIATSPAVMAATTIAELQAALPANMTGI